MSNNYATFTQNVENTPENDPFSSENPWESSFQGLTHQVMSSTMLTQPHHTFPGLLDIKITQDCHLTPQITP